ncbi:ribonucleotide reductase class Ia beta subunit [Aureococcus anophagefferens virus]|uniref:Ribonucleoside-diphosphate reductase small chain n=1 Tax=Aureococcus anophagefferens virus TaxID=1474867 RepID=A0A076FHA2_9VIRU|nr:ribonucleotide reductase class Ia beta subunit [Aureococcus anophagefferens virus]AII17147.1 putative ribonucleotide reductase small subunit [Aureococcus anophagefferens virus]UOG94046.1 Ribonucleotide reductase [Aureococcus anophagefferens virus]
MSENKQIKRYTLFPIKHHDVFDMYKKSVAAFWTVEEIDMTKDIDDWEKLTLNEKDFVSKVLAFFAGSDGIVIENLVINFIQEIDIPEVTSFYTFQAAVESIHSEMYSLLIESLVKNEDDKNKLFDAVNKFPAIKKKAEWAIKWIQDDSANFSTRLVAFACVEGIFFSGAFCAIFWLKKRGLMPGLSLSNQFISRDEALHTEFAILIYRKFADKLDENNIKQLISEAVDIEKEFITEALPCNLIGMNADSMKEYIEFVADRLINQLGYSKIYNTQNPYTWMESISLEGKTNFFESRVSEYSRANITTDSSSSLLNMKKSFCEDADF